MVWESDPELFLCRPHYPASSTIYTKRCLDMTKTVPLAGSDFIGAYPYRPMDFQQLVKSTTTWTQPDFERLLDYISPNHYLVNCQGLVFLEVFPFDENENIAASVPIYVRLFDVIDLTKFGFQTRPKKVPARTIKYIVDGYDAQVDNPAPVVVVNPTPPVVTPPVVVNPQPAVVVKPGPKKDKRKGDRPEFDPSWMVNNWASDWVDVLKLKFDGVYNANRSKGRGQEVIRLEVTRTGTNFGDDSTTNVGRNSFYGMKFVGSPYIPGSFHPVKIADVASHGPAGYAKARFDPKIWFLLDNGGITYAARLT